MTAIAEGTTRRVRREFHELAVARVDRLCDDAVAVTFDVPPDLADEYAFQPGQSLTLRRMIGGRDERRSYSDLHAGRVAAADRRARGSWRRAIGLAGPRGAAG